MKYKLCKFLRGKKAEAIRLCKWIWKECKDWRTFLLFVIVAAVMYIPVWVGYLLHILCNIKWGSVVATAYIAFWAGPFTPFFPLCITITLGIKKIIENRKKNINNRS